MKKRTILSLILIALVALIVYTLASNKSKINQNNKPVAAKEVKIPVTIAAVKQELQEINMVKTGAIAPFKEALVAATASGTIKKLLFSIGDHVKQGQVLAIIDTHLLQIDLQKSETLAAKLKNDLRIYTELLENKAATQEKVNEIRQNYNDAANGSEAIRRQIDEGRIKAATSGIIGSKSMEEGMYASSGTEIAKIVNLSQAKVQVNLTETEVYLVSLGQKVKLTTEVFPDKAFVGVITYISPQADQTHSYQVEITAANDKNTPLRSGTFVYADFSRKTKQQIILIPRSALTESTRDAAVYVVENSRAVLKTIKTGVQYGDRIQVLSGLEPEQEVVTSGQINLKDGTFISVSK